MSYAVDSLEHDEARWLKILAAASPLLLATDARGRIVLASRDFGGRSRRELEGLTLAALGDAFAAHLTAPVLAAAHEGCVQRIDIPGPADSGGATYLEAHIAPLTGLEEDGATVLVTLQDVTTQRQLEEQLVQAQKMEAVGRLAGGLAHDFNNMLTAIVTFGGFVRDETMDSDPRRKDIAEVLRAADRASRLTRQLLTFSRREPVESTAVNLVDMLLNVDRMLRRTLGEDIELVTLLPDGAAWVRIGAGQLEQVLMNLALNARDAMPGGGKLTLTVARRAHTGAEDSRGSVIVLTVEDTGVGMSPEVLKHVFEPFYTTKGPSQGTGLGLATCYAVITQAGGRVSVASAPGRGTRFEIVLPEVPETAAGDAHLPDSPSTDTDDLRGDATVLLVEDEPAVRTAADRILRRHGYRVLAASHGAEALRHCEAACPTVDLLLTDMVMPQLGGADLAVQVLARCPGIKVLFMTGYAVDSTGGSAIEAGGVAWPVLYKPFTDRRLLEAVRDSLAALPL